LTFSPPGCRPHFFTSQQFFRANLLSFNVFHCKQRLWLSLLSMARFIYQQICLFWLFNLS
jgi:hypothetical protein